MARYEEYSEVRQFWAWVIVFGLATLLMGVPMWLHMMVAEVPRQWDFGQLPSTPAESRYTTTEPPNPKAAPRQFEPLPELHMKLSPAGAAAPVTQAGGRP